MPPVAPKKLDRMMSFNPSPASSRDDHTTRLRVSMSSVRKLNGGQFGTTEAPRPLTWNLSIRLRRVLVIVGPVYLAITKERLCSCPDSLI
jgi:hypothetical protein